MIFFTRWEGKDRVGGQPFPKMNDVTYEQQLKINKRKWNLE